MKLSLLVSIWWLLLLEPCAAFQAVSSRALWKASPLFQSKEDDLPETAQEWKQLRERAHQAQIVDDLFGSRAKNGQPLVDLALVGRGTVGAWANPNRSLGNQLQEKQKPILCVFLSTPQASDNVIAHYLKQRYPSWQVPPDLKVTSSPSTGNCPTVPAVPLPLPLTRETSQELKLLSFAFRGRPISKSVFLPLSKLLTNRDGGLWDNLPWTEWTIDPDHKVPTHYSQTKSGKKYLLGRRDAYNRMTGRDWYGRSLSTGNLAARMKYKLEEKLDEEDEDDQPTPKDLESSLAFRILQVQAQEASMELAQAEQNYAMVKAQLENDKDDFTSDEVLLAHYEEIKASVDAVQEAMQAKKAVEDTLEAFQDTSSETKDETQLEATVNEFLESLVQSRYLDNSKDKTKVKGGDWKDAAHKFVEGIRKQDNWMQDLQTIMERSAAESNQKWKNPVIDFLDGIIERESRNAPPYRGAMGFAPQIDTKEEMFQKAVLPYRSPYDLLVEIIQEQFNAQVVGTVLENSSLFPGTLILEGAVVLRRRGRSKTLTIGGEVVELEDSQDDMGNKGVQQGDTLVVECSGAEAIGMAQACNLPISVERKVWEEVVTDITLSDKVQPLPEDELESVMNTIPPVKQAPKSVDRVTVTEGGEALIGGRKQDPNDKEDIESMETKKIRSVADYDALSVPDKARMILSSGNFEGTLPRPRALREFEQEMETYKKNRGDPEGPTIRTTLSPLDEILVPMLEEESVRLELLRRDAYRRNDMLAVEAIERTIDEFNENRGFDSENKIEDDDSIPSISIEQTMNEQLFKEEMEKLQTEDEKEDSIFE